MDCPLRHGYMLYSPMNRPWFTGLELEQSGLTAQAGTAATPSAEGVVLDTTLTLKRESGGLKQSVYRAEFLAIVRALEECMRWSAIVKELSRLCKPYKLADANPKGATVTLNKER
eukprot:5599374-Amphidinium_carterae.1